MGGEKKRADGLYIDPTGSPPRGQGKVYMKMRQQRFPGITPAWAGKSRFQFFGFGFFWDHPRMGGEKFSSPFGLYYT